MKQKLFIELYNFVDDVNTLLSNLSAENFESADIAGVVEGMEKLYNIVEREGLSRLERIKIDKTPEDYHDSGTNSHFDTRETMAFFKGGNIEDNFREARDQMYEDFHDGEI
jgi:hypothetical protein